MRILVDSNVLISALAFPGSAPATAVEHVLHQHSLLLNRHIMDEVERVLALKFPAAITLWHTFLAAGLYEDAEPADQLEEITAMRDPKDLPVLLAAMQPGVDGLLTGDGDFLTAEIRELIAVWSPAEFLSAQR